jgi:hypothetical protein
MSEKNSQPSETEESDIAAGKEPPEETGEFERRQRQLQRAEGLIRRGQEFSSESLKKYFERFSSVNIFKAGSETSVLKEFAADEDAFEIDRQLQEKITDYTNQYQELLKLLTIEEQVFVPIPGNKGITDRQRRDFVEKQFTFNEEDAGRFLLRVENLMAAVKQIKLIKKILETRSKAA